MIILFHGENIVASRAELTRRIDEAKGKGMEIRQLDGKSLNVTMLTQALGSSSLFGGTTFVVIEQLLAKLGKKEKQAAQFVETLQHSADTTSIVLWEDKEVVKTLVSLLGTKTDVQLFKIPVVIFQLLDGMQPGNVRPLITLLKQALERDGAELIFAMVVRRVRQLTMLKDNVTPDGLQGWQAGRLTSQAKSFTMVKLLDMHRLLLAIEVSIKTGTSPFSLAQQLELFFIDL